MRTLNRVLALLLGLALAALGVIVLIELAFALFGRPGWLIPRSAWHQRLGELSWTDLEIIVALAALAVVGLVLLALQLAPRRPTAIPIDDDQRAASIDTRGLQERLRRAAMEDEQVLGARVRARRRRAKVTAVVPASAGGAETRNRVRERLDQSLADLDLAGRYRPKVRIQRAKERVS